MRTTSPSDPGRRRVVYPPTPARLYRLERNVRLIEAAVAAGISLSRASQIERDPSRARPGEIERLRRAVDRVADAIGEVADE
jgi:hypothetical protein